MVDFGGIGRGVADTPEVVTLSNRGTASVSVTGVTLDGADAGDFSISGETCTSAAIPVGGTCTVTLGFRPSAIGARTAALHLTGPGSVGTRSRLLTGSGLDPVSVTPAPIAFDASKLALPAPPRSVTVANIGPDPITVSSVIVGGTNAADFAVTSETCTAAAVLPSASCTINLTFVPGGLGGRAGSVTIGGPSPIGTRVVVLTGTGLDPVDASPAFLDYGTMTLWSAHTPKQITVTNSGGAAVTISGVAVSGAAAADFPVMTQTCTASPVAPSGSCTVTVGFTPTGAGSRVATLTISGPTPVGDRPIALTGIGALPPYGITLGTTYRAGPAYTWNYGNALGRTLISGKQRLHMAYATARVGSSWAKDAGPYAGVYYTYSSSGSTWSAAERLNPSRQHALRLGLAASGSRVYATWVSQTKIVKYSGTAPRVLYVRVNTKHGGSSYWKSAVRLSSRTGRVDYPTIAASGYDVHVAWTDSVGGGVKVATSRDRGVTWRTASVGSTTLANSSGRTGVPAVALAGSTVAVAWIADKSGTVKARVSTDRGAHWGTTFTVGSGANGSVGVAVRGNRVAVTWTTADQVMLRLRVADVLRDPVAVASLPAGEPPSPYSPAVVLQDPARVGVAWGEEIPDGDWSDLRWAESPDAGVTWYPAITFAAAASLVIAPVQRLGINPLALGGHPLHGLEWLQRRTQLPSLLPLRHRDRDRTHRSCIGAGTDRRSGAARRRPLRRDVLRRQRPLSCSIASYHGLRRGRP